MSLRTVGSAPPERPTVLVVDDDTASSAMCAELFASAGYSVIVAEDGARGLKLALEREPDVVLTDLFLPVLDGGEMLTRMRAAGMDVPVVMMSGSVDGKVRAFRLSADGFLEKPFNVHDAIDLVEKLLGRTGNA
jgi:two-component system OmpR family response regulator